MLIRVFSRQTMIYTALEKKNDMLIFVFPKDLSKNRLPQLFYKL